MKRCNHVLRALLLVSALTAQTALAQTDESPVLVMTAQNLMADDTRHQEHARNGGEINALLPGDVVLYRLVFTNVSDKRVRNVEFTDPLPSGLQYVGGSTAADRDDVIVEYSIDRGNTYAARPMIDEIVNGERVQKSAPPELYTHIRWRVRGWVEPGAKVSAEFRARLSEIRSDSAPDPTVGKRMNERST